MLQQFTGKVNDSETMFLYNTKDHELKQERLQIFIASNNYARCIALLVASVC